MLRPPRSTLFPYTTLFDLGRHVGQGEVHPLETGDGLAELLPLSRDRKSTRLNSSHVATSYAVFCLKKKRATASSSPQRWSTCCARSASRPGWSTGSAPPSS